MKWARLLLLPIVVLAAMFPIAHEWRKVPLTQKLISEAQNPLPSRFATMQTLIAQGANVNGKLKSKSMAMRGKTALHFCAPMQDDGSNDELRLLLENGANIDAQNALGDTPLMEAVSVGNLYHVRFLVRNGANVNLKTAPAPIKGLTALGIAKANEKLEKTRPGSIMLQQRTMIVEILKAAGAKE